MLPRKHKRNYPAQRMQELERALKLYPEWKEWFKSQYCPLLPNERLAIECFYAWQKHTVLAKQLGLSRSRIQQLYRSALLKLRFCEKDYLAWRNELLHPTASDIGEVNTKLLAMPLKNFNLSTRLLNALFFKGCRTLNDILIYNRSDFLNSRGFGQKCLLELEDFLKEQGLKNLLQ